MWGVPCEGWVLGASRWNHLDVCVELYASKVQGATSCVRSPAPVWGASSGMFMLRNSLMAALI